MRFRGMGVVPTITRRGLEDLLFAGCRDFRFWIAPYKTSDPNEWMRQVRDHSRRLQELLTDFPTMRAIADLHFASPGGYAHTDEGWVEIARQLKGLPNLVGYGLINEPIGGQKKVRAFQEQLIKDVAFEKGKKIIVTPPRADPMQFAELHKYEGSNRWYEVHMYLPFRVTHQGTSERYPVGAVYPDGDLNKQKLRELLRHVREFQLAERAHIYVGEMAVSSFADAESRYRYTQDLLDIFEEYKWHWTAFVWRDAGAPWDIEGTPIIELLKAEWKKGEN